MLKTNNQNLEQVPRRTINHYIEYAGYTEIIQPTTSNVVFLTRYSDLLWKHFELTDWGSLDEFIKTFHEHHNELPEDEIMVHLNNLIDLELVELISKEGW
jgi:hypothetical protein